MTRPRVDASRGTRDAQDENLNRKIGLGRSEIWIFVFVFVFEKQKSFLPSRLSCDLPTL
jgi:hypothetical protein